MLKGVVSALKDVEDHLRRARYTWNGEEPLTGKNDLMVKDLYTIMACIWYDVSHTPALISKRWVRAIALEPVSRVICLLKDIDFWLISQKFDTYGGFKHHLQASYPGMGQIISPLSRNISTFYSSGEGLPRLRTALRWVTRANFPEPIGLEEAAFATWQDVCLRPWDVVDVRQEAEVLAGLFPRRACKPQLDGFIGHFGSGASADARPYLESKYLAFGTDPMLDYVGLQVDFQPHDMPYCGVTTRCGRLLFVPKQLDKLRTVTMEPCSLMFYQLGTQQWILSRIKRTRWRHHIDLERADLNQDLAWLGSFGEFATIDLSNASDCVRYQLVRALFHDTCLREVLVGTRSTSVEYNGMIYHPTYYAPMGSGLCFPVMCLVMAAVIECVMRRNGDRRAWRVYGDDLIVPSDRYEEVVTRLIELGFEVNLEKSFSGSQYFRESCGGDYFYGENVRPVYVSRFWPGLSISHPTDVESNIQLANSLVGYKAARLRVLQLLKRVKPGILFDFDGEVNLHSPEPTNFHLKHRWSDSLQRDEYRYGILKTKTATSPHEDLRYFETLRAMAEHPLCSERKPISIGRPTHPSWTGVWGSPTPGWVERGATSSRKRKDEP